MRQLFFLTFSVLRFACEKGGAESLDYKIFHRIYTFLKRFVDFPYKAKLIFLAIFIPELGCKQGNRIKTVVF